ncbi:MAG: ATP-binding protein [Prevotella sp.]|nr:ATP-binding protein [Prevotella sp.]
MATKRKYPVGIQSFEGLRKDGYVYVDKTPLIYKMITEGKPYFLSRPRRFGKSLLVSTLAAVFEGRRELFEAFTTKDGIEQPQLFIATTDWEWEKYPVIRFDFSASNLTSIERLDNLIDSTLADYEKRYDITPAKNDVSLRMTAIIRTAHEQTGRRVVVLCDEYDNMMLHCLGDADMQTTVRQRFQDVFGPLKAEDEHLQFVFITGISKFSQMGIFSKLNNLENISMQINYEQICGISEEELTTQLRPDIELLAQTRGETYDETLAELKRMYDGYHFSKRMTDMYNPFSMVKALKSGEIEKYWFDSATPSALIDMLRQMPPLEISDVDGVTCESETFNQSFDSYAAPLPVLYQSGYLTIKNYIKEDDIFILGFPNSEVRTGFAGSLYRYVTNTTADNRERSTLTVAYKAFRRTDDLPAFIEAIKAFFASIPYQWEKDNKNEHYYHALLYTLLTSFGADLRAEEPTAKGQSDLTLLMPRGIYVMEIKYDHTAQETLDQISRKGYTDKYALDGRPITKVGISFSSEERNITEWKQEKISKVSLLGISY